MAMKLGAKSSEAPVDGDELVHRWSPVRITKFVNLGLFRLDVFPPDLLARFKKRFAVCLKLSFKLETGVLVFSTPVGVRPQNTRPFF